MILKSELMLSITNSCILIIISAALGVAFVFLMKQIYHLKGRIEYLQLQALRNVSRLEEGDRNTTNLKNDPDNDAPYHKAENCFSSTLTTAEPQKGSFLV